MTLQNLQKLKLPPKISSTFKEQVSDKDDASCMWLRTASYLTGSAELEASIFGIAGIGLPEYVFKEADKK